jgi:hypothetical protein
VQKTLIVSDEDNMDVNMVFELSAKFRVPDASVVELALGAKVATFQKPEKLGVHMKPLFVKGYLQGWLVQQKMINGGAGVNVMPLSMFEKMGYREGELLGTNTSLSAFIGEVTDKKGILSAELMIGSKTMATTFFVVSVNGRYKLLFGRDWIHSNGCVPSTLH